MENLVVDNEFVKYLATLGVGGAIAGLIFFFYRKDVRSYTDLWKETAAMLSTALKESTAAHVENSATNREMISLLKAVHRRLDAEQIAVTRAKRERNDHDRHQE